MESTHATPRGGERNFLLRSILTRSTPEPDFPGGVAAFIRADWDRKGMGAQSERDAMWRRFSGEASHDMQTGSRQAVRAPGAEDGPSRGDAKGRGVREIAQVGDCLIEKRGVCFANRCTPGSFTVRRAPPSGHSRNVGTACTCQIGPLVTQSQAAARVGAGIATSRGRAARSPPGSRGSCRGGKSIRCELVG
jgi:hypothetical protein